jgi:Ca2+-binding EF-hand superfamily protein
VVTIGALEQESLGVAPRVEGRIVVATAELRAAWDRERELLDWATARLGAKGRFLGEKLKQVRANFALFDRDGDGSISRQELEAALQDQGVAAGKEELDRVWNGVDKNRDGTIDFQEFIDLMSDNLEVTDTELLEAFQKFDVDSNGGLSAGEVLTVLRSVGVWVGEGQVAEMMVAADLDQSGDISYQELVHYMRTL